MRRTPVISGTTAALVAVLALSGCSTKASKSGDDGGKGDVKTDFGVTDDPSRSAR